MSTMLKAQLTRDVAAAQEVHEHRAEVTAALTRRVLKLQTFASAAPVYTYRRVP